MNREDFRASEAERAELAELSDKFEAAVERSQGAGAELDKAVAESRWSPDVKARAVTDLRALAEAATPGPWEAHTVGHRSVRSAAGAVTKVLFDVPVSADVRPLMTDLSWVQADDRYIALTGNGPKQTENAAYIAAANPTTILALLDELDRLLAATPPTDT